MLKVLSFQEIEQLKEYISQGTLLRDICKKMGYYPHVINRTIKDQNIPWKHKEKKIKLNSLSLDVESEILQNFQKNPSLRAVSKIYGCGQSTIKEILKRNNIQSFTIKEYAEKNAAIPEELKNQIIDLYSNQNLSIMEIGKKLNVRKAAVSFFLRSQKIPTHIKAKPIRDVLLANKNKVIEVYNQRRLLVDVAKYFNTNSFNVAAYFDSQNLDYDKKERVIENFTEKDLENIKDLYLNKEKTLGCIGKIYNCKNGTIKTFLKMHNVSIRTKSEAIRLNNLTEEHQRKAIHGMFAYKPYNLPSGKIIKLRGYEPQFLNYIFQNKLLEENEINYKPERVRYYDSKGKRHYYPDFFIPKLNLVAEIKSSYILRRQTPENALLKEEATKQQGFNYILILDNNFDEFTKLLKESKYLQ